MTEVEFMASEALELHDWLTQQKISLKGREINGNEYLLPLIDRVILYAENKVCEEKAFGTDVL